MRDLGKTSLPEGYAARRDRLAVKVSREDKNLERMARLRRDGVRSGSHRWDGLDPTGGKSDHRIEIIIYDLRPQPLLRKGERVGNDRGRVSQRPL